MLPSPNGHDMSWWGLTPFSAPGGASLPNCRPLPSRGIPRGAVLSIAMGEAIALGCGICRFPCITALSSAGSGLSCQLWAMGASMVDNIARGVTAMQADVRAAPKPPCMPQGALRLG